MKITNLFPNIIWPLIKIALPFQLKQCGKKCRFGFGSIIHGGKYVIIGENFFAGEYCYLSTNKYVDVVIGSHIMFGPYVKVLGGNHDSKYLDNHISYAPEVKSGNIIIEDGVWIGANSTILSSATISEGCIVGANSLINKTLPPYSICAGSPAKFIRSRFDEKELATVLDNISSKYSVKDILNAQKRHIR